jgi:hypothetical protein
MDIDKTDRPFETDGHDKRHVCMAVACHGRKRRKRGKWLLLPVKFAKLRHAAPMQTVRQEADRDPSRMFAPRRTRQGIRQAGAAPLNGIPAASRARRSTPVRQGRAAVPRK